MSLLKSSFFGVDGVYICFAVLGCAPYVLVHLRWSTANGSMGYFAASFVSLGAGGGVRVDGQGGVRVEMDRCVRFVLLFAYVFGIARMHVLQLF